MAKIKSKYKRGEAELIQSMTSAGRRTFILNIKLVETSKIKGHNIYECSYVDNGFKKEVHVIAEDITHAVERLTELVDVGIPAPTVNQILGSETLNNTGSINAPGAKL